MRSYTTDQMFGFEAESAFFLKKLELEASVKGAVFGSNR